MKSDSAISSAKTPSKKKPTEAKTYVPSKKKLASKPKPTKKKASIKANRGKGLNVPLVLDELHRKTFGADEGTGDSEEEEDDDDEDDTEDDDGNDAKNDDEKETNSDRTKLDRIKILVLNQPTTEYYEEEEEKVDDEEDDEVTKELYKDVNVNLGNKDADMTDADQGGIGQQNVSQEFGFEQVEEDAHVKLTPVLDTQKTNESIQSSSVSSEFTSKLLNLENPSLADNEIASLMDTTVRHEELGRSDDDVTTSFQQSQDSRPHAQITKDTFKMKAQSSYEAAATLSEFELTKILIDKMKKNKSFDVADYKRDLYDALVKSYNTKKDIFRSYDEVFSLRGVEMTKTKIKTPPLDQTEGRKEGNQVKMLCHPEIQDLEYLKGGDLSRRYSTSVTKTKAATYGLKWIEDLVPELWSPVQLKYDQHAYMGTSHWGPKRQRLYGYASNLTLSKDVYSRRRIIVVTRLKIMKKYDYGHREEIEVRQDDQQLYMFKK
nr:hypothetical protein [Tanacetum cinerariifolium]